MKVTSRDRFEKNPHVVYRGIEDEIILLPTHPRSDSSRQFYFVEGVGREVWGLLDGNQECQKIIETIASSFGVEKGKIEKDILDFIHDLEKEELVRRYDDKEKKS